jgi:hypothetical protein
MLRVPSFLQVLGSGAHVYAYMDCLAGSDGMSGTSLLGVVVQLHVL